MLALAGNAQIVWFYQILYRYTKRSQTICVHLCSFLAICLFRWNIVGVSLASISVLWSSVAALCIAASSEAECKACARTFLFLRSETVNNRYFVKNKAAPFRQIPGVLTCCFCVSTYAFTAMFCSFGFFN